MKTNCDLNRSLFLQLIVDFRSILQCGSASDRRERADVALLRLSEVALGFDQRIYQKLQLGKGDPVRTITDFAAECGELPSESLAQELVPLINSLDEEAGLAT
jgi:hypothetical protein